MSHCPDCGKEAKKYRNSIWCPFCKKHYRYEMELDTWFHFTDKDYQRFVSTYGTAETPQELWDSWDEMTRFYFLTGGVDGTEVDALKYYKSEVETHNRDKVKYHYTWEITIDRWLKQVKRYASFSWEEVGKKLGESVQVRWSYGSSVGKDYCGHRPGCMMFRGLLRVKKPKKLTPKSIEALNMIKRQDCYTMECITHRNTKKVIYDNKLRTKPPDKQEGVILIYCGRSDEVHEPRLLMNHGLAWNGQEFVKV